MSFGESKSTNQFCKIVAIKKYILFEFFHRYKLLYSI